jgi:hypothetical protein
MNFALPGFDSEALLPCNSNSAAALAGFADLL